MSKEKMIQIPETLYWDLCRYHLQPDQLDDIEEEELAQAIQDGLQAKLEAMQRRAAYTAYKDTRLPPEARQEARKAYLDMVAMLPGYRWPSLDPPT